jgi:hypothetical protein
MPIFLLIGNILSAVLPALGAVRQALPNHAANPQATGHLTGLLGTIETLLGLVTGESWPTPNTLSNALTDLMQAVKLVTGSGVITGPALATAEQLAVNLGKVAAAAADYKSGQMAILYTNFSYDGIPGDIGAWSKTGAAAEALGQYNPNP